MIIKRFLVPDGTFVKKQTIVLSVPVARHLEGSGSVKVVLNQIALSLGLGVFEIAVGAWLITIVVVSGFIGIDDDFPLAVKADGLAAIRVHDQTDLLSADGGENRQNQNAKQDEPHAVLLIVLRLILLEAICSARQSCSSSFVNERRRA